MSWFKGVSSVTYAVREDTIKQWAWFWIEGLGGQLVRQESGGQATGASGGVRRWQIHLDGFDTVLVSCIDRQGASRLQAFTETFGDHAVLSVDYALNDLAEFQAHLRENPNIRVPGSPLGSSEGLNGVERKGGARHQMPASQSLLRRVDHVTYAATRDTMDELAAFWVDGMGGALVLKNDDVRPDDPADSMMLWGIVLNRGVPNEELGIALVAGIDREQVSQVTRFVAKNGPNMVQHVAYDVGDMASFRKYFEGEFGAHLLSETLVVPDGFGGYVRQVFGRGYEAGNAAEVGFPEFVERLKGSGKGFTNAAGEGHQYLNLGGLHTSH